MNFLSPETIGLIAVLLFIVGRYYLPPIVLAFALRDAKPSDRAEIVKHLNTFFRLDRRQRRHTDPPASDEDTPPRQIPTPR